MQRCYARLRSGQGLLLVNYQSPASHSSMQDHTMQYNAIQCNPMQEDKSRVNDPEMQCPTYVNDLHLCQYLPPMLMVSTNPPVCSISIFSLHMIVALTLNFMVLYLYLYLYLSGKHESHKREICKITHVTSASFSLISLSFDNFLDWH